MFRVIVSILVITSLAQAKMRDLYVVFYGDTRQQLSNRINTLQCRWYPVGELKFDGKQWYQVIVCKRVNEVR